VLAVIPNLWHFQHNNYHSWVKAEGVEEKFPALKDCTEMAGVTGDISVGAGLHDRFCGLDPLFVIFQRAVYFIINGHMVY
jgi:hypothetical protein